MVATAAVAPAGWLGAELKVDRSPAGILGSQTRTPWREQALARSAELMTLLNWFQRLPKPEDGLHYLDDGARIQLCIETAKQLQEVTTSTHRKRFGVAAISGAALERAFGLLNAAEANILRLAPASYVLSVVPNIYAQAKLSLDESDPRLVFLDGLAKRTLAHVTRSTDGTQGPASSRGIGVSRPPTRPNGIALSDAERGAIVAALEGANVAFRNEQLRVRSFRSVILSTAIAAAVLVILIGFLGFLNPTWAPMCFEPPNAVVCPTSSVMDSTATTPAAISGVASRWDTAVISFMGMLGAALSAAASLKDMRASADPYSLPVALAVLKLPVGGLTAVLGLLLVSAGFVPGLTALDSSAQIIAWAVVLGFGQQLFTRFVDSKARTVLAQTHSTNSSGSEQGAAKP
ncbi:MAG TPA: hypothetical protein VIU11_24105 [Nakamurella sp.]